MCVQQYFPCANYKCNGVAQVLEFIPCEDDPNCEITFERTRGRKRSTEGYCPNCRTMTKEERKHLMAKGRSEKAKRAKLQEGKTNDPDQSVHVEVEQQPDPSAIGERIGATSDGVLPGAGNLFSNFKFPSLLPEEERFLRSNIDIFLRNPHRAELVSGYREPMVEAPANRSPFVSSYPYVTQGGQEVNPGAAAPASKNVSQFEDSFLPRASNQALQYGNLADTRPYFVRSQLKVPSTPQREHEQPAPPSPTTLSEELNSFNAAVEAGHIVNCPSPPPFSSFSPRLSNQSATNLLTPATWSLSPPRLPLHAPLPRQIPIGTALFQTDHMNHNNNARNPIGNMQRPEQQRTWNLPSFHSPERASSSPWIPIDAVPPHMETFHNNGFDPIGNVQDAEQLLQDITGVQLKSARRN